MHDFDVNNKLNEDVSFDDNPFDRAGVIHNEFLETLMRYDFLNNDTLSFIQTINDITNFRLQNLDVFRYVINVHYPSVFDQEGNYLSDAVEGLNNIPSLERTTLNTFFNTLVELDNVNDKIIACKNAERFIKQSVNYSNEMKERLLTAMAIYRYSTYYWNNYLSSESKGKCNWDDIYNCFDALGVYLACNYGDEIEESFGVSIQDGKDVYHYASMVSFTAAFCFTIQLSWFWIC